MSGVIKTLIVDDEELAREDIRNITSSFNELKIIGEASNVEDAVRIVNELKPDLIFLDIHLKGESGFDLLDLIDPKTQIVFVTAFDQYAIRAFEVNAQDYLLKPVSKERMQNTLDRIDSGEKCEVTDFIKLKYEDTVFLQLNNKYAFIKLDSILAISSAGDYTEVITKNSGKGLCSKTMREWEVRLPEKHFSRIHRSTIVNHAYIKKVEDAYNQTYDLYLEGIKEPFIISRGYMGKIKQTLG